MDNLAIYNKVRHVPDEAKKRITGGRLNGMTDINPMWRIKAMTELFGPCGTGWKYVITRREMVPDGSGQMAVFVDVELSYRLGDEWSAPIPGTGGSLFIAKEKGGLYTSDECYKMALTDALSVACKALGVGADVYWEKGATKYSAQGKPAEAPPAKPEPVLCHDCGCVIEDFIDSKGKRVSTDRIIRKAIMEYGVPVCAACGQKREAMNKLAGTDEQ